MKNINWKTINQLNKSGLILALCQDNTGIFNQLLFVEVSLSKRNFYQQGVLGSYERIYPDKIKAAIYLDEICPKEIINKFCEV